MQAKNWHQQQANQTYSFLFFFGGVKWCHLFSLTKMVVAFSRPIAQVGEPNFGIPDKNFAARKGSCNWVPEICSIRDIFFASVGWVNMLHVLKGADAGIFLLGDLLIIRHHESCEKRSCVFDSNTSLYNIKQNLWWNSRQKFLLLPGQPKKEMHLSLPPKPRRRLAIWESPNGAMEIFHQIHFLEICGFFGFPPPHHGWKLKK